MGNPTIPQMFDLTGKCAVVTGGGAGIGQAIAARLAEANAQVVVTDLDLGKANETVERIKSCGGMALAVRADAQSTVDARKAITRAESTFKSPDILVNNAGIFPMVPLMQTTEKDWDSVLDLNLRGAFFYSQAAAQAMIKAGRGGRIINIASIDAVHPHREMAAYNASKAGVVAITKTLALELAPHGILVNAVAPGNIVTPGVQALRAARLGNAANTNQNIIRGFNERMPLGRTGEPDEVARAVLFLAGEAATYMTGTTLFVDGGYLLS